MNRLTTEEKHAALLQMADELLKQERFIIEANAKAQRPSVCNAMETLLVHKSYAKWHLHSLLEQIRAHNIELRGCERTQALHTSVVPTLEVDYATEYNDYILNVRIVDSLDAALEHIARYGTMHSEGIVTENAQHAGRFLQEVDAAAVYHNASTRFTDGFEFGFGAESSISTQKLHARGPMGLPTLTSSKYRIYGTGQIRS
ncbi:gamma-glutamyl phosphate reductase [Paenibacillus popilliae ATCC 14706]|uniref:Gamma-glutamyl phosphate reductase n=1 Tax=Paenibacillus popilliae ATCC 14706 TaxID=1212764 RepID=M9LNS2_PAEPP|nr:gamma-glutamyl phosphate reductase [Paenibacillus popilliae ATCC 14706]